MHLRHVDMQTKDGAQLNLDALYQIAPSCFTEAKGEDGEMHRVVDFNKLRLLLGDQAVEDAPEVYDFTWVGKRAALREAAAPINKTLRPCPEESVDWEHTQNLYIEGDNLEVLKLLQNSYMGKVKMIYIDPPYNTGNDFVYHDDFAQSAEEYDESNRDEEGNRYRKNTDSNGRFHSDWCSMIYARLMVARSLLTEDGVIFISIDDNEVDNLKKVCNEVFGEANSVACISWRRTDNQPNIGFFARVKEYILIYAKSQNFHLGRLPLTEKAKAEYRYRDAKGLFRRSILLDKTRGRKFYPKVTKLGNILNGPWMVSEEEFDRMDANDEIYWTENGDGQPYGKIYLSESKGQIANDFWGIEYGTNQRASLEVEKLFNKRYFDFPKPVSLLSFITMLGAKNDSLVLDFFSGSGTTAHAVMQLNAEDEGNRKFIMVQLPEETAEDSEAYKAGYKNICEIGKERIRRAGKKIKEEHPEAEDLDIGFRVFKCESSNYKDVAFAPKDYTQDMLAGLLDNIKEDRTDLDLLFDCMLRWGVELSLPLSSQKVDGCTLLNVNDGDLVACFDGHVTEAVIDAIASLSPVRVVFRDSSFNEAAQKMNLFELFKQKCDWTDEEVKNNVRVI
jgi:adenine-specific DNA-methyltransferase